MYYILNQNNDPLLCNDSVQWGRWFANGGNRLVAFYQNGDVRVSTIFLGIDHSCRRGPPILFETMIFGGELNGLTRRCATWVEAEDQHFAVVRAVRNCEPVLPASEYEEAIEAREIMERLS